MFDDYSWMSKAIELAKLCPFTDRAFAVGAILVDADGRQIASGYSRDTDPKIHAEESALSRIDIADARLRTATLYSSLEPCSQRGSRNRTPCSDLIIKARVPRVVIAWREPATFVADCVGVEKLRQHGVEVVELLELAEAAMVPNRHLNI